MRGIRRRGTTRELGGERGASPLGAFHSSPQSQGGLMSNPYSPGPEYGSSGNDWLYAPLPPRRPRWKKWWVWVLVALGLVLVGVVTVSAVVGGGGDTAAERVGV